jgi:5-methylcytosine-specific restriction endonuclease McrA
MKKNPRFECDICGKKYVIRQSLHAHKKVCVAVVVTAKSAAPIENNNNNREIEHQRQIDEMKQAFERERQEMKITFEKNMKYQINETVKHHFKTLRNDYATSTNRKKINKGMRQQVVNKQENACGACKLALTSYFQIDHIIGLQFGGTDDESNLMALCCECHAKKSISENQCRKKIQAAIQTILRENISVVR